MNQIYLVAVVLVHSDIAGGIISNLPCSSKQNRQIDA